ncbi:MAG TPA: ABC transporter substrate-binding protein [Pseudogracilibacillus sp.]|nr:ABC transporter substrate-binding protein [Pseudogracilibacillus sp.]
MKRIGSFVIVLIIIMGGCSSNSDEDSEKELTVATTTTADSLDPHNTTDTASKNIFAVSTETLVKLDEDGEVVPSLAKDWEEKDDGKTWVFKLEEDVTFHDGEPFNAEAVKTNFERVTDEDKNLARYSLLGPYIDEIIADEDNNEVTFHLNKSLAPFLNLLAQPSGSSIVSPKMIEEDEESIKENPVGTGPYEIKDWSPTGDTIFVANTEYWGDSPQVDKITWKSVPENSARATMLENGEADIIVNVLDVDIDRLDKMDGISVETEPLNRALYVGVNTEFEPFDSKEARQALNYAINKEELSEDLYKGEVTVSTAAVSEQVSMHSDVGAYPYDKEKAKKLLEEAGVEEGTEARLIAAENVTRDHRAGEYVQNSLQEIGLDVKYQEVELSDYLSRLENPEEYELFLRGSLPSSNDIHDLFSDELDSESDNNYSQYSSTKVDELISNGAQEMDEAARKEIYKEALETIKEDAPWIFLYDDVVSTGISDDVEGLILTPDNTMYFDDISKKE